MNPKNRILSTPEHTATCTVRIVREACLKLDLALRYLCPRLFSPRAVLRRTERVES